MANPTTRTRPAQAPTVETPPPSRDLPAKVEPSSLERVRQDLTAPAAVDQLRALLPAHVTVDRFVSTALLAVQRTPALLNCTGESVFQAVLGAARDGLLLDGREAAAVPFGKEAQYLRMVEGRLKLVRQSGQLKHIDVQVVYPEDAFDYYTDETGPHLRHRPNFQSTRREPKRDLALVYATATTLDGGVYIEVMDRDQVERARLAGRAKDSLMWASYYDEGARKTVVNRLFKRLPKATDIPGTEDDEDALHPSVEAGVARGFGRDASIEMAAREARTRETWHREDAAKGLPPRGRASAPAAPEPAAGPAPKPKSRYSNTWRLYHEVYGRPTGGTEDEAYKAERLKHTAAILELPADRVLTSWGDLLDPELLALEARLAVLAAEKREAAAADGPDDPDGQEAAADDAPVDEQAGITEPATELFPPRRGV